MDIKILYKQYIHNVYRYLLSLTKDKSVAEDLTQDTFPFNNRKPNEEQFMDSLHFLANYEDEATKIARAKWLDLNERIHHLENYGIHAYGGVITGPTKEILKMENHGDMRAIHLGEVRLWNW